MTKDGASDGPHRRPRAPTDPIDRRAAPPPPTAMTAPDGTLIGASLGEPAAFAAIFDRHWAAIHRFCTSRAGNPGEDLAAETFRVAFDARGRFDTTEPSARPWLFGIATNLLRAHFRRVARGQQAIARLDPAGEPDLSEDALRRIEAERLGPELAAALASLTATEREALLLLAWAELTYDEIAAALEVPVGTVRSRIHRARTAMRATLPTSKDRS